MRNLFTMQTQFPTFRVGHLALCLAISCAGCTSRDDAQPPTIPAIPDGTSLRLDPEALPEGWTSSKLSVNHSFSGDSVDIVMTGEGVKLSAAIDSIRDRLSTTVTIASDVDENAELKNLEIEVKAGSWDDLPEKIAEDYGYEVSTQDGETRINRAIK
jgi:hypothetical protein